MQDSLQKLGTPGESIRATSSKTTRAAPWACHDGWSRRVTALACPNGAPAEYFAAPLELPVAAPTLQIRWFCAYEPGRDVVIAA
jgi:hypothetical protein